MFEIKSYLKFLVKMKFVAPLRALFLFCFGAATNKKEWEKRMLLVNLEGIGDLIVMTGVLKHYRQAFPGKKIYLLVRKGIGVDSFLRHFVDEIIFIKYRKFSMNPLYGTSFVNYLRRLGFQTVINNDFSAAEINGKIIAGDLKAEKVIGYEGIAIEKFSPFDIQQKKDLAIVKNKIYPSYTKIISSIERGSDFNIRRLRSVLSHYIAIYENMTGKKETDYSTFLPCDSEEGGKVLDKFKLAAKKYAILNLNASVAYKRWPLERFWEAAEFLNQKEIKIVLVGGTGEKHLADKFEKTCSFPIFNLAGKTSFKELVFLIKNSLLVLSNDTSAVHAAVALKVPSVSIVGGGQFGMFSNYGYPDINRFVYKKEYCFGDNWRCGRNLGGNEQSPCISNIQTGSVIGELELLLDYLNNVSFCPQKEFSVDFPIVAATPELPGKIKIVYSGIEAENYNPKRKFGFEYNNFFLTFQRMAGVEVIEYPYDPIVKLGKKKFNEELLDLIKKEKPDLFFAFMFSDELDEKILDEIKGITTSLAWFADDQWRLDNYSRFYAPHFTWAVTTWSEAPEKYLEYGITNIVRSQWACNADVWKPVNIEKDINVSFIGRYNSSRAKIIKELRHRGIDVFVRGWGWPEGKISQEKAIEIISRSKINLNFNVPLSRLNPNLFARLFFRRSIDRIIPDVRHFGDNIKSWFSMSILQIKARPFEILGCNAFLISGYADDMENYYREGKEIVYYNGKIKDLAEKIRHYLLLDEERKSISQTGYERTLREHTYEKRFKEIFRKIL